MSILPQSNQSNKPHKPHIQFGPPFHCPACGQPVARVLRYNDYLSPRAIPKPLDAYGEYVNYLVCGHCEACTRIVRIGHACVPFTWPEGVTAEGEVQVVHEALAQVAQVMEANGHSEADPALGIVFRLLAGWTTPQAAAEEIRELCFFGVRGALDETAPTYVFQGVGSDGNRPSVDGPISRWA